MRIEDYKDVIKQAYRSEMYWALSKQIMAKGRHWYNLEIPVATPRGIEFSAPPTAPSIVNDAADHLAGNWPEYAVKPLKETQTAEREQERVQIALNGLYKLLAREYGKAIHRSMAIHGGWSGMMAAQIMVREGWDYENPSWRDLTWQPLDPRFVYPDPGSLGKEFVIYRRRAKVGQVRQKWPDWEGQWYSPSGWGSYNTGPSQVKRNERLPDDWDVDWLEYWDDEVKCFICNGFPVFREAYGQDIVPHGLGCNPIIIRSAGYGDDTGEPHERFRAMIYYIFSMLEAEARLWTQYKWIVEDTAWPILLAHNSLRPLALEPGKVNYADDLNAIKDGIRSVRDDQVDPKALIDVLAWVQGSIERATYPTVLKGQAPNGISAGYPIAILSTQARLKFASPSDALQSMLEELAYKTLQVIDNRIGKPLEVLDQYKLYPEDYANYLGRIDCKLEPNLPTDIAAEMPKIELAVGSLGLPKEEALKELGYADPTQLRDLRLAEDLAEDPRVRQIMAEHFIKRLAPEYAEAVQQQVDVTKQIQELQQNVQVLQGHIQQMTMQQQADQMQQQMAAQQQQAAMGQPPTGGQPGMEGQAGQPPQGSTPMTQPQPPQQPPAEAAGQWGGARPDSGGSPLLGQNPGNPNNQGQSLQQANPETAVLQIARNQRAQRSIEDMSAQNAFYGSPRPSI